MIFIDKYWLNLFDNPSIDAFSGYLLILVVWSLPQDIKALVALGTLKHSDIEDIKM